MRSYLRNLNPGADPCRAMMEVIKKESGRWIVSKVVSDHAHPLAPPSDPGPAAGMEFDSVSMAREFYSNYGEKTGFGVRAGLGRRARGGRALVMQRFVCAFSVKRRRGMCGAGGEGESGRAEAIAISEGGEKMSGLETDLGDGVGGGCVGGVPAQSRLLREFGIRVSRYTDEERRDIVLRYMRKRNSRQVVDRSVKVMMFLLFM